jgi:hypothetical protein
VYLYRVFVVKTEGKKKTGNNSRMTWPRFEPGTSRKYKTANTIRQTGVMHFTTRSSYLPFKGVFMLDFLAVKCLGKKFTCKAKKDDLTRT